MEPIKVSAAIITFRQEKYILQALEGAAMQRGEFPYEIYVSDDASPDSTCSIIRKFAASSGQYEFRMHFRDRNAGMVNNWLTALDNCRGEYIAVCEGDDFWTDPEKIMKQAAFMDAHPECALCYHEVEVIDEDGLNRPYPYEAPVENAAAEDVIASHFIPTVSVMIRKSMLPQWPRWIYKARSLDIAIEMMLATKGRIMQLPGKLAVYRQHGGGISKSSVHIRQGALRQLFILKKFNCWSKGRYDAQVKNKMKEICIFQLKYRDINGKRHRKYSLLSFFKYYLYAAEVRNFRSFRHAVYLHLMPELYNRLKKQSS